MALHAIGDVQGCEAELRALLRSIGYRPDADRLWFAGDLVNRGPASAKVLRFVMSLGDGAVTVLGNHELHLLAVAAGHRAPAAGDTFHDILEAPDRERLLAWLRRCPLLHHDPAYGRVLVHAGLSPHWDLEDARREAAAVEAALQGAQRNDFLGELHGDEPSVWSSDLAGAARLRYAVNCLTRIRLCDPAGRLHLRTDGRPFGRDDDLIPWFKVPGRPSAGLDIVFGHWSKLGRYRAPGIRSLDSGCVWGGRLTALRLDADEAWFSVPCPRHARRFGGLPGASRG